MKTFSGPLNATIVGDEVAAGETPPTLLLNTLNTMASSDVTILGSGNSNGRDWYTGTFDVETKYAQAHVVEPSATRGNVQQGGETRTFEYDDVESDKSIGWVGYGRRGVAGTSESHVDVISSIGDVVLRFG